MSIPGQINTGVRTILNLRPEITLFRKVFRRLTNFTKDIIEIPLTGNKNFGGTSTATIPNSGTFISDLFIEIELPALVHDGTNNGLYTAGGGGGQFVPQSTHDYINWVNAIGFAIINNIELSISGTKIEKHSGLWLNIWNELTDVNRKEWDLVRKVENASDLKYLNMNPLKLTIPLKFFFCLDKSQSLPIGLIGNDSIKLQLVLNSFDKLVNKNPGHTDPTSPTITSVKLFGEFITAEQEEINLLRDTATEGGIKTIVPVIEYFENTGSGSGTTYNISGSELNLTGAIKEIIWVFRHKNRFGITSPENNSGPDSIFGNNPFAFYGTHKNETLGRGTLDTFSEVSLKINESEFLSQDAIFFGQLSKNRYHSNNRNRYIYVHSFAFNPEQTEPSGQLNLDITDIKISLSFTGVPGHTKARFNNSSTSGTESSAADYKVSLFAIKYKLLTVNVNSISFRDIPFARDEPQ